MALVRLGHFEISKYPKSLTKLHCSDSLALPAMSKADVRPRPSSQLGKLQYVSARPGEYLIRSTGCEGPGVGPLDSGAISNKTALAIRGGFISTNVWVSGLARVLS